MPNFKIPTDKIREAIQSFETDFDSHDVIRVLAHSNQWQYIRDLQNSEGDAPFQTYHSHLGREIKDICESLGIKGRASRSKDLFHQESNCIQYTLKR